MDASNAVIDTLIKDSVRAGVFIQPMSHSHLSVTKLATVSNDPSCAEYWTISRTPLWKWLIAVGSATNSTIPVNSYIGPKKSQQMKPTRSFDISLSVVRSTPTESDTQPR